MSALPARVAYDPRTFVSLSPYERRGGDLADPVDHEVARLLPEEACRGGRFLPYAREGDALYVASASWPLAPAALAGMAGLGVRAEVRRTSPEQIADALDRVWPPARRIQLGATLERLGKVSPEDVAHALAQQTESGGRLGGVLMASGRVTYWDIAEAVAAQYDLPLANLIHEGLEERADLFGLADEEFWRQRLVVPTASRPGHLTLAMVDPSDDDSVRLIEDRTGLAVTRTVTGYRDVLWALDAHYRNKRVANSRDRLRQERPDDSAATTFSPLQGRVLAVLGLLVLLGFVLRPHATAVTLVALAQGAYLIVLVFRFWLMQRTAAHAAEIDITPEEIAAVDDASLPLYTVLVPAYREARVLPTLIRSLKALDYPKDRLDVKLLLEEDDPETLAAARSCNLPNFIDIVVVPKSFPTTKPKACNYGLLQARGAYVVIFDAEDAPEPDQLKKAVVAFRKSGPVVGCVQAKLSYFNDEQNILTRWFTAEYAMWFDLLLPALSGRALPIPLGGTSNHFRADALRRVGMWDPHNVAEDADLGIRIHKLGYQTAMMDSTTFEEANSEFVNWVRQRSRWIKGYMQTWLVHMRHPVALWRELGPMGFLTFQVMVGGTPWLFLLNPVFWFTTTVWFLTYWTPLQHLFPGVVYFVAMFNLCVGNFAFTYIALAGLAERESWALVRTAVVFPVYWAMMSVGAWKALLQMVMRPSFWEKTEHGLTDIAPVLPADDEGAIV